MPKQRRSCTTRKTTIRSISKTTSTEVFSGGGGRILDTEAYSHTDTDFSPVLAKIKALQPDVFYLPDY